MRLLFPALALVAACGALAQESPVVLKGDVREVVLDVVVRDKHGRVVRDLAVEELKITDDGAPVKPAGFRLIEGTAGTTGETAAAPATAPRLFTLMFEQFGPEGRTLAREAALTLLKAAAGPRIYFSVLAVGTSTTVLQPFTDKEPLVRAAIEKATAGPRRQSGLAAEGSEKGADPGGRITSEQQFLKDRQGFGPDINGLESVTARSMQNMLEPPELSAHEVRGGPALRVLLNLARRAQAIPGRKTVVYFCEGLQVPESRRQQFRDILEAANRANLSVYPIDVSGLNSEMPSSMMAGNLMGGQIMIQLQQNRRAPETVQAPMTPSGDFANGSSVKTSDLKIAEPFAGNDRGKTQSALAELATNTGGFLVANTNNMKGNARRIAEEALTYYEVTYVPPPSPLDGRFKPVSVTSTRSNVSVQSRNGYLAVPPVPGRPMQSFELPLYQELTNPQPRHDFPHRTSVVPLRAVPDGVEVAVLVESSLGDMQFQDDPQAALCRAHGSMLALIRDSNNKIVERAALDSPFQGPLDRAENVRQAPWQMEERVVLAPGSYVLESAVFDVLGKRSSVQSSKFTVEPWQPGPHISALTYARGVSENTTGSKRAFQASGKAIEPVLELRLKGGKGSQATVFFLAHGIKDSTAPVTVSLEVLQGNDVVAQGQVFSGPVKGETPLVAKLDAAKLPGGDYQVRITAKQDGQASSSSLPLAIDSWVSTEPMHLEFNLDVAAKKPEEWKSVPPNEEQKKLLDAARQRAVNYTQGLPNFSCLQTTRRLEDLTGKQDWRQKDEYSEVISWLNGVETYDRIGGRARKEDRKDAVKVTSAGEFGSLLKTIFQPESKTDFRWERSESFGGRQAEVFAYRVEQPNSQYYVFYRSKNNLNFRPGYRGVVTIDTQTAEVLHLEAEMEEVPKEMQLQGLRITVDYEPASVGGRDYLLPSAATLVTQVGRRRQVRNELRFTAYRRFETESKIQYGKSKD